MADPFRQFPRGRLNAEDEGALPMAIGVEQDTVVIVFPKMVSWVGLPAEMAEEMAATLQERAKEARRNRQ